MIDEYIDRFFIKNPRLRRFVTKLLEGGDKERRVQLLGSSLCISSVKEHGYLRAARLSAHCSLFRDEITAMIHLAALMPSADCFLDIGANVGVYSVTLEKLRKFYPSLSFHAFEANPDTFGRLQKSLAGTGVAAHCIALSDTAGTLEFVGGAVSNVFTTVGYRSKYQLPGSTSMSSRRLDSFDLSGNRMILKIDVEGQEAEVLRGAEGFFEAGRVLAVYLDGYENRDIETWLGNYGFTLHEGRTLSSTKRGIRTLLAVKMRAPALPQT